MAVIDRADDPFCLVVEFIVQVVALETQTPPQHNLTLLETGICINGVILQIILKVIRTQGRIVRCDAVVFQTEVVIGKAVVQGGFNALVDLGGNTGGKEAAQFAIKAQIVPVCFFTPAVTGKGAAGPIHFQGEGVPELVLSGDAQH